MLKHTKKRIALLLSLSLLTGIPTLQGNSLPVMVRAEETQDEEVSVNAPVLSLESGFYDGTQDLIISAEDGMTIYYTTDGSTPDTNSNVYTEAIRLVDVSPNENVLSAITDIKASSFSMWGSSGVQPPTSPVDKANVIRAIAVDSNGIASEPVTGTYFIDYQNKQSYYQNMKVISLVTDSSNLFDYEKGIYVLGKVHDDWKNGSDYDPTTPDYFMPANYTQKGKEWERPAVMQIFENGNLVISQNIGIRIHGGATRSEAQKSFNVYARKEYGAGSVKYDLFNGNAKNSTGESITKFDSFILRNGGNDGSYSRWRDKLNQTLVSNRAFLTQAMENSVVFIDGEYWGQYEITEKLSDDFIHDHFDVPKKNVCIIKNQELDEGDEAGLEEFNQLWSWIKQEDFTKDSAYQELCEKIDMRSFADYISAEIYINNNDWGANNMALWKAMTPDSENPYADGKWRFIMFDTEYSTGLYGQCQSNQNTFEKLTKEENFLGDLFSKVSQNEEFRKLFATIFMDIANENFSASNVNDLMNTLYESYLDVTVDTYARFWPGNDSGWMMGGGKSERNYREEKNTIRNFYNGRYNPITSSMKQVLQLKGNLNKLTLNNDSSKGYIQLNTTIPTMTDGTWSGRYYSDYPVVLEAFPEDGLEFKYWETSDGQKIEGTVLELSLDKDITVTAVYGSESYRMGDVNDDGTFNLSDIVMFHKWIANVPDTHLANWKAADFEKNGILNIYDYCLMKRDYLNQK